MRAHNQTRALIIGIRVHADLIPSAIFAGTVGPLERTRYNICVMAMALR